MTKKKTSLTLDHSEILLSMHYIIKILYQYMFSTLLMIWLKKSAHLMILFFIIYII